MAHNYEAQKIECSKLSKAIAQQLRTYSDFADEKVTVIVEENAAELLDRIKRDAPVLTGSYKKGWKMKKSGSGHKFSCTIYNKTDGNLSHLLEFGHAKKGGGRVNGIPHLYKNEKDVIEEFEEELGWYLGW